MKRILSLVLALVLVFSCIGNLTLQAEAATKSQMSRSLFDAIIDLSKKTPGTTNSANTDKYAGLGDSREIVQVLSNYYSSIFAVLYSDGTVGVGGTFYTDDDSELDAYAPALKWKNIKKIYLNQATLIGLCEDGTVVSVAPQWDEEYKPLKTSHLKNVVDIAFMEPGNSYFFLLEDGTVRCEIEGYNEPGYVPFDGVYKRWKGVKKLIPYYYYDIFAIFEDGTVASMGEYGISDDQSAFWTNMENVYIEDRYYGIQENGSVVIYDPYPEYSLKVPNEGLSLTGAEQLYCAGEVMFGLDRDGKLLVSGGKDWFYKNYDKKNAFVSWSEFDNIKTLYAKRDFGIDFVMGIREDGKPVALKKDLNKYVSQLPAVKKLAYCIDTEGTTYVLGLQENGNVVGIEMSDSGKAVVHDDTFRGWNVLDLYATHSGVLLGFNADGSVSASCDGLGMFFISYNTPVGYGK